MRKDLTNELEQLDDSVKKLSESVDKFATLMQDPENQRIFWEEMNKCMDNLNELVKESIEKNDYETLNKMGVYVEFENEEDKSKYKIVFDFKRNDKK